METRNLTGGDVGRAFAPWLAVGLSIGILVGAATARLNSLPMASRDGALLLVLDAGLYGLAAVLAGALLRLVLAGLVRFGRLQPGLSTRLEWAGRAAVFWLFVCLLALYALSSRGRTPGQALGLVIVPTTALLLLSLRLRWGRAIFNHPSWLLPATMLLVGLVPSGFVFGGPRAERSGALITRRRLPLGGGPRRPLLLVGLDGLDPRLLKSMLERGELPTLSGIVARGALGEVETFRPTASPLIWTTVATGKLPEKHGVRAFVTHTLPGMNRPICSYPYNVGYQRMLRILQAAGLSETLPPASWMRRTKALWNIAADTGRRAGIVNWWASWPAEDVGPGVIVTDRLFYHERFPQAQRGQSELVFPLTLYGELRDLVLQPDRVPAEQVEAAFSSADGPGILGEARWKSFAERARYWIALDETHLAVSLKLLEAAPFDLFAVYFRGTDLSGHSMTVVSEAAGELAAWRVLEQSYRAADRQLASLVRGLPTDTSIVICSDHGFGRQTDGTFGHSEAPAGVLILAGPDIEPGARLIRAHVRDVAPTVLHLLGYPVARDMDGRVLEEALRPRSLERSPITYINSYDSGSREGQPRRSYADTEVEEQLRSLGYIQ